MYTEKVMDHFQHPRNVGEIENASGVGTVGNAKCGDIMRIYLDIDENQIIRDESLKHSGVEQLLQLPVWQQRWLRKKHSGSNGGNKQSRYGSS